MRTLDTTRKYSRPSRTDLPARVTKPSRGSLLAKPKMEPQKPSFFKEKVPAPVYDMAQDDQEHWETFRQKRPKRYKESESCHFSHQPNVHNSKHWWLNVKKEVAKASGIPDAGYAWISKVEDIEDPEHLQVSEGKQLLDAKVAAGLSKILHGDLAKQIQLLEEKAEAEKKVAQRSANRMVYQRLLPDQR